MAGLAQAALIQNTLDDFTLFAGNRLVAGSNITINGQTGSGSDMRLGRLGQINGDLFAHGKLNLGNDSGIIGNIISGKNLVIGSRSQTKSASGAQNVNVNKHAVVHGTLAYGAAARIHPLAHIRDFVSTDLDTWNLLPVPSQLPNFPAQAVQDGFTLHRDRELTLSPSAYGNVRIAGNGILHLSAGEYNFKNIVLGPNAQIVADTTEGSVTVNVSENLKSSKGASLFSADETLMTFNVGRNLTLGNSNKIFAMLNSAKNMKIGNASIVTGSFVAGNNLRLGKGLEVNSVKTTTIPEPTTLALLGGGLLSILVRKRNKCGAIARN
jgi:hypothetical protein